MFPTFCPVCQSPYFVNRNRYTEITGKQLEDERVVRLCIACGFEVRMVEMKTQETAEVVNECQNDYGDKHVV